jgi:hypothetical protein
MDNYNNIKGIYNDSNLRITMERYSYNLWALIALIGVIFILRIINQMYLYNAIVIFILIMFFVIYFSYVKTSE